MIVSRSDQATATPGLTFAQRVLLGTAIVVGAGLLLVFLWFALRALLVAFAGLLLAILLRAPTDWLAERTRLSEGWALALVVGAVVLTLTAFGVFVAPQVAREASQLAEQVPRTTDEFRAWLEQYTLGTWILGSADGRGMSEWLQQATGMAYTTAHAFMGIVIFLFVSLYLAAHPRLYLNGLLRLFPLSEREHAAQVMGATGYLLRWWLVGTLVRMAFVGVMTFIGLWMLGMPLALALAALAFLLDFVPYFGPIIASIPGIMLGFGEDFETGVYVTIMYVVVQQVESLLITPIIYHRTVYLPPVLTILAQIVLFGMFGVLGGILATPLAAVALTWVKMLYVERFLGDRVDTPLEQIDEREIPPVPQPKPK